VLQYGDWLMLTRFLRSQHLESDWGFCSGLDRQFYRLFSTGGSFRFLDISLAAAPIWYGTGATVCESTYGRSTNSTHGGKRAQVPSIIEKQACEPPNVNRSPRTPSCAYWDRTSQHGSNFAHQWKSCQSKKFMSKELPVLPPTVWCTPINSRVAVCACIR